MTEGEKERTLDALLDSALCGYSEVEPRAGLEIRIRANLRAHATQRRQRQMLIFAGAATAMLILTLFGARTGQPIVQTAISVHRAPLDLHAQQQKTMPTPQHAAATSPTLSRDATDSKRNNLALLQIANTTYQFNTSVPSGTELESTPDSQVAPEPDLDVRTSPSAINIQDLNVRPVEIKNLCSC